MKPTLAAILGCALLLMSCAVTSKQIRKEAISGPSFEMLINDVEKYRGKVTIVGGHVLEIENRTDGTQIKALQVPLQSGEKPGSKDLSKGRLIIWTSRFLDPEIYTKGRKITVAGKIVGSSRDKTESPPLPYLKLEAIELHLWPEYQTSPYYYPYNDPFWTWNDPWYWGYYPFAFRGSWYWRYHPYRRW